MAKNYVDISSSVTNGAGFTTIIKTIREYADGTVSVNFEGTYSGAKSYGTPILTGLPDSILTRNYVGYTGITGTIVDIELIGGQVWVGISGLGSGNTIVQFGFEYKKA